MDCSISERNARWISSKRRRDDDRREDLERRARRIRHTQTRRYRREDTDANTDAKRRVATKVPFSPPSRPPPRSSSARRVSPFLVRRALFQDAGATRRATRHVRAQPPCGRRRGGGPLRADAHLGIRRPHLRHGLGGANHAVDARHLRVRCWCPRMTTGVRTRARGFARVSSSSSARPHARSAFMESHSAPWPPTLYAVRADDDSKGAAEIISGDPRRPSCIRRR